MEETVIHKMEIFVWKVDQFQYQTILESIINGVPDALAKARKSRRYRIYFNKSKKR
jgi:hypothetical protein